jgi:hypothetical protein
MKRKSAYSTGRAMSSIYQKERKIYNRSSSDEKGRCERLQREVSVNALNVSRKLN